MLSGGAVDCPGHNTVRSQKTGLDTREPLLTTLQPVSRRQQPASCRLFGAESGQEGRRNHEPVSRGSKAPSLGGAAGLTGWALSAARLLEVFKKLQRVAATPNDEEAQNYCVGEARRLIQDICDEHMSAAESSIRDPAAEEGSPGRDAAGMPRARRLHSRGQALPPRGQREVQRPRRQLRRETKLQVHGCAAARPRSTSPLPPRETRAPSLTDRSKSRPNMSTCPTC